MNDSGHVEPNSPWTLTIDEAGVRRERDTSSETGVPSLPFEKQLRGVFMGVAGGVLMLGDEFSSTAIKVKSEELAYGWALLAKENEHVKVAIKWILETSAWSEAIVPTAMTAGVIAYHYNLIPDKVGVPLAEMSGLVPLSREQEIEIQRRQMAAQKQAAEAQVQAEVDNFQPSESTGENPSVVEVPSDHDHDNPA